MLHVNSTHSDVYILFSLFSVKKCILRFSLWSIRWYMYHLEVYCLNWKHVGIFIDILLFMIANGIPFYSDNMQCANLNIWKILRFILRVGIWSILADISYAFSVLGVYYYIISIIPSMLIDLIFYVLSKWFI